MSTRRAPTKSGRVESPTTRNPADNVTEFPVSRKSSNLPDTEPEALMESAGNAAVRPIDAIADHVLAARYLSAEWQDRELSRLLDMVLLQIGQTIAALDGPVAQDTKIH